MKNKNGFTLIEIIGVVTILSIILIVAVPSLTKTLKRNQQNKYNDYINNIKIITENYVVNKLKEGQFFEDGKDYNYISLGNLIDAGYIKDLIKNPENNKTIARDTRIKISKEIDGTFQYDVQEYYNNASDYADEDLIIHYDAVEYSSNNKFKSLTDEGDYSYSDKGYWTETGVYLDKDKTSSGLGLDNLHETNSITVSFNINFMDALNSSNYTHILLLKNTLISKTHQTGRFSIKQKYSLFYRSGDDTVFSIPEIVKNENYTITFVQDGLTTRKVYVNGVLSKQNKSLVLEPINYNHITINPLKYNLKLNNMLIYNRALSDEEVKELYSLDKERFGE